MAAHDTHDDLCFSLNFPLSVSVIFRNARIYGAHPDGTSKVRMHQLFSPTYNNRQIATRVARRWATISTTKHEREENVMTTTFLLRIQQAKSTYGIFACIRNDMTATIFGSGSLDLGRPG